jgi:hypothetical protein
VTDLNTRLCERLRVIEACPVCGSRREEFHTHDRMAFAIFTCGVDVIAGGGRFIVALGCTTKVTEAFALIKAEEQAKP